MIIIIIIIIRYQVAIKRHYKMTRHESKVPNNVPSELCTCTARTQLVRRAHTRNFGAHINVPSKMFFARIPYT